MPEDNPDEVLKKLLAEAEVLDELDAKIRSGDVVDFSDDAVHWLTRNLRNCVQELDWDLGVSERRAFPVEGGGISDAGVLPQKKIESIAEVSMAVGRKPDPIIVSPGFVHDLRFYREVRECIMDQREIILTNAAA